MKIGIIKEGKIPTDKRTPLTPRNCVELMTQYQDMHISVQPSKIRVILDEEYKSMHVPLQEDMSDRDVLFGIKEIPVADIIPGKTYFIFSHTIKAQSSNRKMLQALANQGCTLIDYECIKDPQGNRLISFGYFAGLVGAYNTLRAYMTRYRLGDLKSAHACYDMAELRAQFRRVKIKPIKIALTGGGRVAHGAMEALEQMKIRKVNLYDFLNKSFSYPVFTQLHSEHFHVKKGTQFFDKKEFYKSPNLYESRFMPIATVADVLIACAYWNPKAPKFFTEAEMRSSHFRIKVIGDITCDIQGSIPSTKRTTSIENPFYDYNPFTEDLEIPFSNEKNITVMAIDNLPCELSRDASENFGKQLISHVFPALLQKDTLHILERATILKEGKLTPNFSYLSEYLYGPK